MATLATTRVEHEARSAERDPGVAELERLWSSPAIPEPAPVVAAARPRRSRLGLAVAVGWALFLAVVAVQPVPANAPAIPIWAELLFAGFFLSLAAAGVLAVVRGGRAGWVAAAAGGLFGLGLAVGCASTSHHPAGWWAFELATTATLLALSVAGLARRR